MMLMMIAAIKATIKFSKKPPVRLNESLSHTVSISIKVLITRVNNPSVTTFIGSVKSLTIGRTKPLTNPKIIATKIRLSIFPLKLKLENSRLVNQIANALINILKMSFTIFSSLLSFGCFDFESRFLLDFP